MDPPNGVLQNLADWNLQFKIKVVNRWFASPPCWWTKQKKIYNTLLALLA